jgi:hypothetical protein
MFTIKVFHWKQPMKKGEGRTERAFQTHSYSIWDSRLEFTDSQGNENCFQMDDRYCHRIIVENSAGKTIENWVGNPVSPYAINAPSDLDEKSIPKEWVIFGDLYVSTDPDMGIDILDRKGEKQAFFNKAGALRLAKLIQERIA